MPTLAPTTEARCKGSETAMSEVIQHLRRTMLLRDGAGLTDGQLLKDYIGRRDEAALAALVRRHGPMVWGVCRRLLRNYHEAEDAFQATFLVLVRKAASVVPREMVANWLYGVARQTALKARATAATRKTRERQVTEMPEPAVAEQNLWHDLQPVLDAELSRLPDKYRAVIVLCDLEGKTRKEAARQLAVPEGSVAGWLPRARAMLAKRLAHRGVVLSGGVLGALLAQNSASAGVPNLVVSSTIKAASVYAAGQAAAGVISAEVAALTEGVLKAMLVSKLKIPTAALLIVLACVGGGTVALLPGAAGQQTATEKQDEKQQKAQKADDAFPGEWKWADGQKGGLTRIVISKAKDGWSIQTWAEIGPPDGRKENDLGKTTLHLLRDYEAKGDTDEEKTMNKYGFATWDHKFVKRYVTLRVENDRLIVEEQNIFTDKSDRPNYRSRYEFKKK
jgi:RNA polymerase sigma factor (sigma-70 family)